MRSNLIINRLSLSPYFSLLTYSSQDGPADYSVFFRSVLDIPAAYRTNNDALVKKQKASNAAIFLLGTLLDIKVVATNDIHFVDKEDGIVHDRLLCIMRNCRVSDENRRRYSHLEYMKSEQEMLQLFPEHPEVIENTLKVLDKVKRYDTRHRKIS